MNTLKRFSALVLALALMVICFAGCHEKNELAVKIGDIEFTSGYYACVLFFADKEARLAVEDQLPASTVTAGNIKYWDYKVENTEYVKWVEDTTLNNLKKIAFIKSTCAKANIALSAEEAESSKLYAESLWAEQSTQLEENGVSKETFIKYVADISLENTYFEYLYGKGGQKEIGADELKKQLSEHYMIANILPADFSGLKSEEQKAKSDKFVEYEKALKEGKKTFEEIYQEVYKEENGEEHKHDEPEEGEKTPKDLHASLISDVNENYTFSKYDTVKEMKVGDVKIITLEDNAGLYLVVKKDILEDPYYIEEFDSTLRLELKEEEFTKALNEQSKSLAADVSSFATGRFDVKKIKYSQEQ